MVRRWVQKPMVDLDADIRSRVQQAGQVFPACHCEFERGFMYVAPHESGRQKYFVCFAGAILRDDDVDVAQGPDSGMLVSMRGEPRALKGSIGNSVRFEPYSDKLDDLP